MSRPSKMLTLSRIEDLTLGSFAFVPTSETLDHLVRYLSTWSGSDKFFMIIQYAIKLIVPFLQFRARMQHNAGLRPAPVSASADGLAKLGSILGDARMLFRIWGLLPIIQWLTSIERSHPQTRKLLTIERLQGWSMIAYYPLEHLYYLLSHSIIAPELSMPSLSSLLPFGKAKPGRRIRLDLNALGIWSCRFWAAYVVLQFMHLREDARLLKVRERVVSKSKAVSAKAEKEELKQRWDALWNELIVNLGYLPLTVHWSLEQGLFSDEVWVGVFGLIAGLAQWRSGWKATALPTPVVEVTLLPTETRSEVVVAEGPSATPIDFDLEAPTLDEM
ncbi:uncharacterized protein LAESUDRAFT_731234 [Laetiporus sulphureus 93-53]|uniref:Uncharacterized protein n=1 Tax=Laetiporus sulphureus 93-53 TaxID=1314785 RepID=A0A165BNU6_9APHY|nr:uncharacterized protein LAESUDRAFT_731234 [Laetiporus sulphureus 93-53]KZT01383.1 hypothetical protein LAESUDRAFT_731234 [Laetiporus sulphureus 93-53]